MPRLNLSSFLFESPIKIWKAKQTDLSQEQFLKAEKYFEDLTGSLKDYFRKDLTSLSFDQIELLYLSIKEAKNFGIGAAKGGSWLTNQILLNPYLIFQNIKEDYIPVLVSYNRNLKNPEIKNLNLDEVPDIQELNRILNSIESEICFTASEAELGKVVEKGGWEVFLPTTTEASIVLGKRGCGKRDNVWCTTREDGRNLFLNYALVDKVTLFYVIKKNTCADKGNPEHKMSVGFVDAEPKFDMGDGRITVDAANKNLTFERFQRVLGKELANEFLEAMKQKAGSLGGEPPAFKEAEMLVASPKRFIRKFEGYPDDENGDEARRQIAEFALRSNKTHKDVFIFLAKFKLSNIRGELAKSKVNNIRIGIAQNPNAPEDALRILAGDEKQHVREKVALNPNTPEDVLRILARGNADIRFYVALNPNTPEDVLRILAEDQDQYVREKIAKNQSTPKDILIILARDENSIVRSTIAKNPNAPEDALRILTGDKKSDIRYNVAQNPNAPEDILRILARDKDQGVRLAVARNPNALEDILRILAGDENSIVRTAVAQNPNIPEDALRILARDKDPVVRSAIAQNPNIPEDILRILAGDESSHVRETIAKTPNIPEDISRILAGKNKEEHARIETARNKKAPEDVLRILARDENSLLVRVYVAQNPNIPEDALRILAVDKEKLVRLNVAQNPNTPEDVLRILAGDGNPDVRLAVARNPNAPREALIKLAYGSDEYIRSTAIKNAANRNIPLQESKHRRNKLKLSSILFN